MSLELRIVLIVVSILVMGYVLRKIRGAKFNIVDSIYWIVLSAVFLLFAVFPQIPAFLSALLGIRTPVNFILMLILALLLLKVFLMSVRVSQQDEKIKLLSQKIAIDEFEARVRAEEKAERKEEA